MRNKFENDTNTNDISSSSNQGSVLDRLKFWRSAPTKALHRNDPETINVSTSAPIKSLHESLVENKAEIELKPQEASAVKNELFLLSGAAIRPLIIPNAISLLPLISHFIEKFRETVLGKSLPSDFFKDGKTLGIKLEANQATIKLHPAKVQYLLQVIVDLFQGLGYCLEHPEANSYIHISGVISNLLKGSEDKENTTPLTRFLEKMANARRINATLILYEEQAKKIFKNNSSLLAHLIPIFLKEAKKSKKIFGWNHFLDSGLFCLIFQRNGLEFNYESKIGYLGLVLKKFIELSEHCLDSLDENHYLQTQQSIKMTISNDYFKELAEEVNLKNFKNILAQFSKNLQSSDIVSDNTEKPLNNLYYARSLKTTQNIIKEINLSLQSRKFSFIHKLSQVSTSFRISKNSEEWDSLQENKDRIFSKWIGMCINHFAEEQLSFVKQNLKNLSRWIKTNDNNLAIMHNMTNALSTTINKFLEKKADQKNYYLEFQESISKFIQDNHRQMPLSLFVFFMQFSEFLKKHDVIYVRPAQTLFYCGKATAEQLDHLIKNLNSLETDKFFIQYALPLLILLQAKANSNPSSNYFYITQNLINTLLSYILPSALTERLQKFMEDYNSPFKELEKLKKKEEQELEELHEKSKLLNEEERKKIKLETAATIEIQKITAKGIYTLDETRKLKELTENPFIPFLYNNNTNPDLNIYGEVVVAINPDSSLDMHHTNAAADLNLSGKDQFSLKHIRGSFNSTHGASVGPKSSKPISPTGESESKFKSSAKAAKKKVKSNDDNQKENISALIDEKNQDLQENINLFNQQYLSIKDPKQPSPIAAYNVKRLYFRLNELLEKTNLSEMEQYHLIAMQGATYKLLQNLICFEDFQKLFEIPKVDLEKIGKGPLYELLTTFSYNLVTEEIQTNKEIINVKVRLTRLKTLQQELAILPVLSPSELELKKSTLETCKKLLAPQQNIDIIEEANYNNLFTTNVLSPLGRYLSGFKFLADNSSFDIMKDFTILYQNHYTLCTSFLSLFSLDIDCFLSNHLQKFYDQLQNEKIVITNIYLADPNVIQKFTLQLQESLQSFHCKNFLEQIYKKAIEECASKIIALANSHMKIYRKFHADFSHLQTIKTEEFKITEYLQYFKKATVPDTLLPEFPEQELLPSFNQKNQSQEVNPNKEEEETQHTPSNLKQKQEETSNEIEIEDDDEDDDKLLQIYIHQEAKSINKHYLTHVSSSLIELASNPELRRSMKYSNSGSEFFYKFFQYKLTNDPFLCLLNIVTDIIFWEHKLKQISTDITTLNTQTSLSKTLIKYRTIVFQEEDVELPSEFASVDYDETKKKKNLSRYKEMIEGILNKKYQKLADANQKFEIFITQFTSKEQQNIKIVEESKKLVTEINDFLKPRRKTDSNESLSTSSLRFGNSQQQN